MSLVDRMKESRKVEVVCGEMKFIGRRPTLEEAGKFLAQGANSYDISYKLISGWENVKEKNLFPGGSDDLVPFSFDVYKEFIADSPDVAESIANAILTAFQDYMATKEALQKN